MARSYGRQRRQASSDDPAGSARAGTARPARGPQIRQHRLAGDRRLAEADQHAARERQVDVDPRAEADQAETLAGARARRPP